MTLSFMNSYLAAILVLILPQSALAAGRPAPTSQEPAAQRFNFVLTRAKVISGGASLPASTDAVAISGTQIAELGSSSDLASRCQSPCRVIDLQGKFLAPGFHDAHAHPIWGGSSFFELNVSGSNVKSIAAALKKYAQQNPATGKDDEWISGGGWNAAGFGSRFPTAADLDAGESKRPVALTDSDGHQLWVNSAAIELAGVDETTPDPVGGRIGRDAQGKPTGMFFENAMDLIFSQMPETTAEQYKKYILRGEQVGLDAGVSTFHGGAVALTAARVYRDLDRAGQLSQRSFLWLSLDGTEEQFNEKVAFARSLPASGLVQVTAFKGYVDGVISSYTAALLEPYHDRTDSTGDTAYAQQELDELVLRTNAAGFPVALHAIGDRAVRMALNAYENSKKILQHSLINRIEHIEVVDPLDIPRFGRIGVAASVQPAHMHFGSKSSFYYYPRLGSERVKHVFAWNELYQGGALLLFGSDYPVVSQDPIEGLYCAVHRVFGDGSAFESAQKVTGTLAFESYTSAPARAVGREDRLGKIQVGFDADLIALDQDPRQGRASSVSGNPAKLLMVAGKVVRGGQ